MEWIEFEYDTTPAQTSRKGKMRCWLFLVGKSGGRQTKTYGWLQSQAMPQYSMIQPADNLLLEINDIQIGRQAQNGLGLLLLY
jgi:phage terminase large subunit-like protein